MIIAIFPFAAALSAFLLANAWFVPPVLREARPAQLWLMPAIVGIGPLLITGSTLVTAVAIAVYIVVVVASIAIGRKPTKLSKGSCVCAACGFPWTGGRQSRSGYSAHPRCTECGSPRWILLTSDSPIDYHGHQQNRGGPWSLSARFYLLASAAAVLPLTGAGTIWITHTLEVFDGPPFRAVWDAALWFCSAGLASWLSIQAARVKYLPDPRLLSHDSASSDAS